MSMARIDLFFCKFHFHKIFLSSLKLKKNKLVFSLSQIFSSPTLRLGYWPRQQILDYAENVMCKHSSLFIRSVSDDDENFKTSSKAHFQDMPMTRGVSGIKLIFSSLLLFHNKLGRLLDATILSIKASITALSIMALSIK
jgi:hypothetical protein